MQRVTRRKTLQCITFGAATLCCPFGSARATTWVTNVLCATQADSGLQIGQTLNSSGNQTLDRSLASEMLKQSAFFSYRPAFILYSGGEKNAAATTNLQPGLHGTQGTIYYNLQMLQEQLGASEWGGAVVAGVIAHEFGHIFQFFSGYMRQLRGLDTTVKFVELHADFLSGFYMGGKSHTINIQPYADAFFRLGDYGFNSASHHGTPEERYLALKAGYNYRLRHETAPVSAAAEEGQGFLREYIH